MWLERTTAPSVEPLTLAEVKAYLRVDYTDEDTLIAMLIASATEALDGWSSGKLGRALITQEWRMHLDGFPSDPYTRKSLIATDRARAEGIVAWPGYELGIDIPLPPLQSVGSVKYLDADGVEQTLAASTYTTEIRGQTFGRIRLNEGQTWPSYRAETGCVRIDFTAGYGDAATDVPAPIKLAMLMQIGHAYDNRGDADAAIVMSASNHMLAPYRLVRF